MIIITKIIIKIQQAKGEQKVFKKPGLPPG